jgi:CheY-like chemotaxis protein
MPPSIGRRARIPAAGPEVRQRSWGGWTSAERIRHRKRMDEVGVNAQQQPDRADALGGMVSPLGCRVLIVEDDPDLRAMIDQLLFLEGFDTITAENGLVALDVLSKPPRPHVILLDLMMPVMDGWRFREQQRRNAAVADIPVVVLSAVAERAANFDAVALLAKPLNIDRLVKVVRAHCSDGHG